MDWVFSIDSSWVHFKGFCWDLGVEGSVDFSDAFEKLRLRWGACFGYLSFMVRFWTLDVLEALRVCWQLIVVI